METELGANDQTCEDAGTRCAVLGRIVTQSQFDVSKYSEYILS